MTPTEQLVLTESVRLPHIRNNLGSLRKLGESIRDEGMRHPITLWSDGTLISGARRHRAAMLLQRPHIQAVFVHTIEDAAKSLARDYQDDYLAMPFKAVEMCRLWELLRRLDEPAYLRRTEQARRRGVQLRRQTQAGARKPGRASGRVDDYVQAVIGEPFGISPTTGKRLWTIYGLAYGTTQATDEKREQARQAFENIDAGTSSIWANYQRLVNRRLAPVARPRPVASIEPAEAARQRLAWDRSLPQLEGLLAGLTELGPPNPELTWEQVGPVHARLKVVRRDLEKIINKMRESNQS